MIYYIIYIKFTLEFINKKEIKIVKVIIIFLILISMYDFQNLIHDNLKVHFVM